MAKKSIYLPGLNGIRAIAAIAVVISHVILNLEHFGLFAHILGSQANGKPQTWNLAGYGVTMFFTLSGFLITYLLRKEKEVQAIQVKKFYIRRALRIWPLYYAYFLICMLVILLFKLEYTGGSIWYYIFYSANIPFVLGGILPLLGHFWSLGVEEQFYIFWPWVNRWKSNQVVVFSIGMVALMIGAKLWMHIFHPDSTLEMFIHVTRFHCMLIGGVAAIAYYSSNTWFMKIVTHKLVQWIGWIALLMVALNRFHVASVLDNEIFSVVTVVIIMGQVTGKGLVSLENKYFDFLGKISYGIYVIHPLLIFLLSKILRDITPYAPLNYFIVFASVLGTTIASSYLSYRFFESRFLILKKKKYTVVNSRATMADS